MDKQALDIPLVASAFRAVAGTGGEAIKIALAVSALAGGVAGGAIAMGTRPGGASIRVRQKELLRNQMRRELDRSRRELQHEQEAKGGPEGGEVHW